MQLDSNDLLLLLAKPQGLPLEALAHKLSLNPDTVRRVCEKLLGMGLIEIGKKSSDAIELTDEGITASKEGLPEIRLLALAKDAPIPIQSLEPALKAFGLAAARKAGWVDVDAGSVCINSQGMQALEQIKSYAIPASVEEISRLPAQKIAELEHRRLVRRKTQSLTFITITPAGIEAAKDYANSAMQGAMQGQESGQIGQISRDMLLSGAWKGKTLKRYDTSAPLSSSLLARRHPISRLRERVSSIFLQMGFEQMQGPLMESAFWNFDALFQPQDHPARDLADTFYVEGASSLPSHPLVQRVQMSHEKGWNYSWDERVAKQKVLRTHTTAVSARTLYAERENQEPRKFFSVGKVFRNEATDYKHLAEFFQVEGIISWDGATFPHLLGVLKSFYAKMGFEKIRFRPSFFPYTEPSLEIEVFHPLRKEWLELGGAGILRPEVSVPLCGKYPVLAWGLSLERPLMLASKTEDIRTLYRNDLGWLRNFPLGD